MPEKLDKPLTLEDVKRNIEVLREGRRSAAPTPKTPRRKKKLSRDPKTVDLITGKADIENE